MMTCAMYHAPNLNVQNRRFRLLLHKQLEAQFPLKFRNFAKRTQPRIVRGYVIIGIISLLVISLYPFMFI